MKRKTERERFEAWCERTLGYECKRDTYNPPQYDDCHVEEMWLSWQAAKRDARRARNER